MYQTLQIPRPGIYVRTYPLSTLHRQIKLDAKQWLLSEVSSKYNHLGFDPLSSPFSTFKPVDKYRHTQCLEIAEQIHIPKSFTEQSFLQINSVYNVLILLLCHTLATSLPSRDEKLKILGMCPLYTDYTQQNKMQIYSNDI